MKTIDRILELIECEGLEPGSKLGTEKGLADRFDVSLRSVREAVIRLKALGIVTSRRKAGITISDLSGAAMGKTNVSLLARTNKGIRCMAELRMSLELGAVRLVSPSASGPYLKIMHEAAEAYAQCAERGTAYRELLEADRTYHRALLRATENPMIYGQCNVITDCFHQRYLDSDQQMDWTKMRTYAQEHFRILEALEDENVEYATIILSTHLGRLEEPEKRGKPPAPLATPQQIYPAK